MIISSVVKIGPVYDLWWPVKSAWFCILVLCSSREWPCGRLDL